MSREHAARFWQKEVAAARRTGPTLERGKGSKTKAGKKRKWKGINEGDWQESVGRAGAWFTWTTHVGRCMWVCIARGCALGSAQLLVETSAQRETFGTCGWAGTCVQCE